MSGLTKSPFVTAFKASGLKDWCHVPMSSGWPPHHSISTCSILRNIGAAWMGGKPRVVPQYPSNLRERKFTRLLTVTLMGSPKVAMWSLVRSGMAPRISIANAQPWTHHRRKIPPLLVSRAAALAHSQENSNLLLVRQPMENTVHEHKTAMIPCLNPDPIPSASGSLIPWNVTLQPADTAKSAGTRFLKCKARKLLQPSKRMAGVGVE